MSALGTQYICLGSKSLLVSSPSIVMIFLKQHRNVGFLRYWTLSNIPLFLLATPMLLCLVQSSRWAWTVTPISQTKSHKAIHSKSSSPNMELGVSRSGQSHRRLLQLFSVPQLALALLALTTYHVQVITRLSSGYPVWYWWLASTMLSEKRGESPRPLLQKPYIFLRWMMIYAVIQGGLFASFLPPA